MMNQSGSGAPAAGHAVRDYFSTDEIFHRVAASAEEEFSRSTRLLFFSGLAAGLSIGLSFLARAAATGQLPAETSGMIGNLLYPIGFLLIVLGRYQLFTENTLTPVTLVLTRIASLPMLLRNWGVVLIANLIGAGILAVLLAGTGIFEPEAEEAALSFAEHAFELGWGDLFFKGIIAGWLVASMVWLVHAARDTVSRIIIVFFVMYLVPTLDLYHCVIGACEAIYYVLKGGTDIFTAGGLFFLPVLLGNTVGGVLLVAILNFSQTRDDLFPNRDLQQVELTWREWFFGQYTGVPVVVLRDEHGAVVSQNGYRTDTVALYEPVTASDQQSGPEDALLTIVQYGDYESHDSRELYRLVDNLRYHVRGGVRYVFRHLPLSRTHPNAVRAALAAEAAGRQEAFWEMHEKLFQSQGALTDQDLLRYARDLNLDIDRFRSDMNSSHLREKVSHDRETAVRSGVRTPDNLFINDVRYTGPMEIEALRDHLNTD